MNPTPRAPIAWTRRHATRLCAQAWLLVLSLLLPWCVLAQGAAGARVALVVGNDRYASAEPLSNAARGGREVAAALRRSGFEVIEVIDGSKAQIESAIERMRAALQGRQGVGLFYYAGHAVQIDWRNFIVPVDAALRVPRDVAAQTVDVSKVLDAFAAAGTRTNILVLDACRDNPFGSTGRAAGLAPMDAPPRSFLAFSTAPGNVAEDGVEGGHSLYTYHLLQELARPKARIEDVFKRVRLQVRQRTSGRQVPWESTSLEDEFFFDNSSGAAPNVDEAQRRSEFEAAFEREKADWERVSKSTQPQDLYEFMKKYPSGAVYELAQFKLDQIQKTSVRTQVAPTGVETLPSGMNRFEVGDAITYERSDMMSNETRPYTLRVTAADKERVEINGGQSIVDQMGGVLRNRFGDKSPASISAPADIALGKRWRSAFINTQPNGRASSNYWNNHVVALEDLVVPAGTVRAYRIEREGWAKFQNGVSVRMKGTTWVDPRTMLHVRVDLLFTRNGQITENSSDRLVRLQQAPRTGAR
ncbi:MAG TPA: caspase family protein [Ramlibacter sp.]|nr:caspase family protein [Ramlibacter sp.]